MGQVYQATDTKLGWAGGTVMKVRIFALVILVPLVAGACSSEPTVSEPESAGLVIRNVRIFDGQQVVPETEILVEDGVIAAIGQAGELPTAATEVDGSGQTLLPGLIDSHTHLPIEPLMRQAVVFGVTTQLDMHSDDPEVVAAAKAFLRTEAGGQVADLFAATTGVTAPGGHGTQFGEYRRQARFAWGLIGDIQPMPTITEPEEAQAFVDQRIAEGADYIKILYENGVAMGVKLPSISGETLEAVIAAAQQRGKLAVVHITALEAARDAVAAGADGLVHTFADQLPDAAFGELVASRRAFVIPTLTIMENVSGQNGGPTLVADERLSSFLSADARAGLEFDIRPSPESQMTYTVAERSVQALHSAGVSILAGTDAANPGTTWGASMHRELELLVQAGLTPLEALSAATAVPAKEFHLSDRGQIAPGFRADLLLVNGDPTTDVTMTRDIVAVWKAGVRIDRDGYRAYAERQSAFADAARAGRVTEAVELYDEYAAENPETILIDETGLNALGYRLLREEQVDTAIAIFQLVVREYPESWSAYDSLGAGYMVRGDVELAIANYERSLELHPDNENGRQMLEKLQGGQ